ncbi:MAG TPA: endolytic transglycosylase MltG, partial [Chloroflexia bacterium]|nr:endolytic transglycosylase MltG [Chloroflexia bacterium]
EDWQFGFLNDKPVNASVEGFLFPDTYRIPANYTESQIVEMMLRRFGEQYDAQLREKARDNNGIYKTVIIASLVEREAAKADERPKIASVFYNRLKLDMKLETDPTVQWARDTAKYAKDSTFSDWWKPPTKDDLAIDSPYNTYKNKGLPPGPICNPGLASLKAATEPLSTDFLYFVATGDRDGSHAFARTLEEHNQNVKKYQGS